MTPVVVETPPAQATGSAAPQLAEAAAADDPQATATPVIRIRDLVVEYRVGLRGRRRAVDGLNLEVRPGEVVGFLGMNGAGKTSAINVLLGFSTPRAGTAHLFGEDARRSPARQRIGYLPERTDYPRFLTARETLRTYAAAFGMNRGDAAQRIADVLEYVGLAEAADRPIRTYSKGMTQRVGLAQAMLNDPDLLILDEPTSGLDPAARMIVRSIIEEHRDKRRTVFFSSHELSEVELVCDRIAILMQGRLVAEGPLDQLKPDPAESLERFFLRTVGVRMP
jgi:ABC-2 type transport system ATP-binding protein